jgi:hypothetical protein
MIPYAISRSGAAGGLAASLIAPVLHAHLGKAPEIDHAVNPHELVVLQDASTAADGIVYSDIFVIVEQPDVGPQHVQASTQAG